MSILENKIEQFALALINEEKAQIIVSTNEPASGFWFGGGNMVEDKEGNLYITGRYRNFGDSRTGLDLGDRGLELGIFQSIDKGKTFSKIHSIMKVDFPNKVLSIEGTALNITPEGTFELFISSEKTEYSYPKELEKYLKQGTGVWTIDVITAPTIQELTIDKIKPVIHCTDAQFIHVKDPFIYNSYSGDRYLLFCTHPFNWSSSNTGYLKRKEQELSFEEPVWEFFKRGYTWDVAMTRGTCILDLPQIGMFKDNSTSLFFYDGGECVRNIEQHNKAIKRPRGYSCEELGGLAYIQNHNLNNITRISKNSPLFLSPYGTACSRYVSVLTTKDGMYATWQQSQKDCSQPLVMNFLSTEEINSLLS